VNVAAACPAGPGDAGCLVIMEPGESSGGGERVAAEFGQEVAGLPDDLAGLRQGGALGVLAVGDGGVVAVVGGGGAGVGLAGLDRPPSAAPAVPAGTAARGGRCGRRSAR